ncbi:hypothetical protein ACJ41O_002663 [Fusarium nematophilum]
MGRPRKRRHVEEGDAPLPDAAQELPMAAGLTTSHPPQGTGATVDGPQEQAHIYPSLPLGGVDHGLSFLDDSTSTNLEFWDLLPNDYLDTLPHEPQILAYDELTAHPGPSVPPLSLSGVDLLGAINFDEPDHSQAAVSKDLSDSLQRYMAEQIRLPQAPSSIRGADASTPADSTLGSDHGTSIGSPDDSATTPPPPSSLRSIPTVSCGCLSSLYLALDSLTRLPNNVIPAMRVARNACRVAHDVIKCTVCSEPLVKDPTKPPPMQCFQNLMLLGALIPSACNAYATILEMVDAETALAKKQGRTFWFAFKDIGGLWGYVGDTSNTCQTIQNYNNKDMAPDMWRMTIRALLRLDVYGFDGTDDKQAKHDRYTQMGLKDVVEALDERSRKRHEILDDLMAAGHTHGGVTGVIYPSKPCTPEQRTCVKVLETARIALENLVIA